MAGKQKSSSSIGFIHLGTWNSWWWNHPQFWLRLRCADENIRSKSLAWFGIQIFANVWCLEKLTKISKIFPPIDGLMMSCWFTIIESKKKPKKKTPTKQTTKILKATEAFNDFDASSSFSSDLLVVSSKLPLLPVVPFKVATVEAVKWKLLRVPVEGFSSWRIIPGLVSS